MPVDAPATLSESLNARRLFLPLAGGLLLILMLAVAGIWWQFQGDHVVSRNALVRSHLSELGVRGEGVVTGVFVVAGDRVKKGDLLVRLEDAHLLAERAQLEATLRTLDLRIAVQAAALELAREQASVQLAQARSEFRQTEARAEAARVQAEDSEAFHEARIALGSGGAVSAEVIRDAAAKAAIGASLAAAADAAMESSRAQLQAATLAEDEVALKEGDLRVLKARRDETLAELDRIEADIASTRVRAPADGAVVRRLVQPGMSVNTGTPLLSLWLTDDTWIEAWIPEERFSQLTVGSEVSVRFPALPGRRYPGRVERIGLATDFEMPLDYLPKTREMRMRPTPQVGVQIRLDDLRGKVRPGMSAIVDIHRGGA